MIIKELTKVALVKKNRIPSYINTAKKKARFETELALINAGVSANRGNAASAPIEVLDFSNAEVFTELDYRKLKEQVEEYSDAEDALDVFDDDFDAEKPSATATDDADFDEAREAGDADDDGGFGDLDGFDAVDDSDDVFSLDGLSDVGEDFYDHFSNDEAYDLFDDAFDESGDVTEDFGELEVSDEAEGESLVYDLANWKEGDLTIRLAGSVIGASSSYDKQLESLWWLVGGCDMVIASAQGATENEIAAVRSKLAEYGIYGVGGPDMITLHRFVLPKGTVGVVVYDRDHPDAQNAHVKLEIGSAIKTLRDEACDYVIVYINERPTRKKASGRTKRLYQMVARLGADCIVGVSPRYMDAGKTYSGKDGKAVPSYYSLGALLSKSAWSSRTRAVVSLKLKSSDGSFDIMEETYFPLAVTKGGKFVDLADSRRHMKRSERLRRLAQVERSFGRMNYHGRTLTLSKLLEIIGEELPDKYAHLADKPVGQICARTLEVSPGDVFFFREPFDDPNDLEPVDPRRRMRLAERAKKRGAFFFISFTPLGPDYDHIVIESPREAHIKAMRYVRDQLTGTRVIGITGSIGKTSTKDMLYEVMKTTYRTQRSEHNSNTQVKIGVRLQSLTDDCEIFLQEIGGGRPGGASRHARMVGPEVCVITNIGDAHIGNFYGDKVALMNNKLGVTDGMPENGTLYLNGDDPLLVTAQPNRKVVYYAVHNKDADYYADDVVETDFTTSFTIVHGQHRVPAVLNVLGEHNVLNAVCCYAIGMRFGVPERAIIRGLLNFHTSGVRQNVVEAAGRTLLLDCYNASSASVETSLKMLDSIEVEPGHKKVAVFGDLTGMGELVEDVHREMGNVIAKYPLDEIVLFGDSVHFAQEVLAEKGIDSRVMKNHDELDQTVAALVGPGDAALFKGSSKRLLEQSCDVAFGTRFTDQRFIQSREFRRVNKKRMEFNLFNNYATLVGCKAVAGADIVVPAHVSGFPVVNIARVFTDRQLHSIELPDTVRHIAGRAFEGCRMLESVKVPSSLKYIGNYAFRECESLEELELPQGLLHIGKGAFRDCVQVKRFVIPSSVVYIGEDAFFNCFADIACEQGSYAQTYLEENGIPYELV